jgi:hypothetical protein
MIMMLCFASFEQNKHNNGGNYCGVGDWGQFWDTSNIKEMRKLGKGKCGQFKRDLSLIHAHLSSLISEGVFRFWQQPELNGHAIIVVVSLFAS